MDGYDHLTPQMAKYPDLAIFRKFSILNYRMLLYLQAELEQQEERLIVAITTDRTSEDAERRQYSRNFDALLNPKGDTESAKTQRKIMEEIRPVLKDYSMYAFSLQNYDIDGLPSVHASSLECLRDELMTGPHGRSFLHGRELLTWGKGKEYDLISLGNRNKDRGALTAWVDWWVTKVYNRFWGYKRREPVSVDEQWAPATASKLTYYRDNDVARWVTGITTILAPVLPTMSACALFFIDDQLTRLGVTVLLSFIFSGALAIVGLPRRIDSFVATATFTALLIVFVSNNTECNH